VSVKRLRGLRINSYYMSVDVTGLLLSVSQCAEIQFVRQVECVV
jgi:hypothetical protein